MAGPEVNIYNETIASVRKEAISAAAKWAVGAVVALVTTAASGWFLYLKGVTDIYVRSLVASIPIGAVVAFDADKCPSDWVEFKQAAGRSVIGAGQGFEVPHRAFRQFYGAESVVLTANNLPAHQHETGAGAHPKALWGKGPFREPIGSSGFGGFETTLTSPAGKNPPDPVQTLSPSIALSYCKKER